MTQPQKAHSTGSTIFYGWGSHKSHPYSRRGERESISWWEVPGFGGAGGTRNIAMPFLENTIYFLFAILHMNYTLPYVNSDFFSMWDMPLNPVIIPVAYNKFQRCNITPNFFIAWN